MLSLPDAAAIRVALNQPLDGKLRDILTNTLATAEANGVADHTHVLVVQPGDFLGAVEQELGFSLLQHPIDGTRFGEAAFLPYWSFLKDVGGWFQLIQSVGNSFAHVVLVEDREGVPAELLRMCRTYSGPGEAG